MVDEQPLGRVLDPDALSSSEGARGRVRVEVPETWLGPEAEIELVVPARIVCARCDGGGCDGCNRSGALRTPDDLSGRTVRFHLPEDLARGAALRLVEPFGELAPIEQLIVELRLAAEPSAGVSRVVAPAAPLARWRPASLAAVALAVASAIAVALLGRSGC